MPEPYVLNLLAGVIRAPVLASDGNPRPGQGAGNGRIVEIQSRGPGIPVMARNPLGRKVVRVSPWNSDSGVAAWNPDRSSASVLTFTPQTEAGTIHRFLVE